MTTVVLDAPRFDLTVTESPDHRGVPRYLIRYGLEAKKRDTLAEAIKEAQACLAHAAANLDASDEGDGSHAPADERTFGLPPGYTLDSYAMDDWLFFDADGMDDGSYPCEEAAREAAWRHYEDIAVRSGRVPPGYSLLLGDNGDWGVRDPEGRWIQEGASDKETACRIALAHYRKSRGAY